jgi:hypothetical protein
LELLKRTLLRWKPIYSLTTEYWIFMELNHTVCDLCVCICVCGPWGGFKIFSFSVSVKCSVPNNATQQCFLEVTNFDMAHNCYSKDQVWQPLGWGNVLHSLNMSSVCSKILRHVFMYIIGFLQMIAITVMYSTIDSGELVLISSLS